MAGPVFWFEQKALALLLGHELRAFEYVGWRSDTSARSLLPPRAVLMLPAQHFSFGLSESWEAGGTHPCSDVRLLPTCGVYAIHFKSFNKCGMLRASCLALAGLQGEPHWFAQCRHAQLRHRG